MNNAPAGSEPVIAAKGPVVVIADDDTDIRRLIELACGRAGTSIGASVADGVAALQAIRDVQPDMVIMDVSMPGLTGLEVCRSVRSDPDIARIPIMLLSAAVQPEAIRVGLAAGADRYAHKPFSPRSLSRDIQALLTRDSVSR
jgi:CheY-like chemotaxis protein